MDAHLSEIYTDSHALSSSLARLKSKQAKQQQQVTTMASISSVLAPHPQRPSRFAAKRRPRVRSQSPLPEDKSAWYKLSTHLLSDHHAYAFHDEVIARLPADSFSSVRSIVEAGVKLATLPEMQVFPHTITHVLRELIDNPTLPRRPGQPDMRLVYDRALARLQSVPGQPEHAEYRARLSTYFDFVATIPLRLQCHRPSLHRPLSFLDWPPADIPQLPADVRTAAEIRQQSAAAQPDHGLTPWAAPRDWTSVLDSGGNLYDMLLAVLDAAYSVPGLTPHNAPDAAWMGQHARLGVGVTHASEYIMRIVYWCVSMYWAAMVWNGSCAVCGQRIASWNSHRWLAMIPSHASLVSPTSSTSGMSIAATTSSLH